MASPAWVLPSCCRGRPRRSRLLALIAILIANMTGANRLLIGIAWLLVIALAYLRFRRQAVELKEGYGLELVVLLATMLDAFVLPFKDNLTLLDMAVLLAMFGFYIPPASQA